MTSPVPLEALLRRVREGLSRGVQQLQEDERDAADRTSKALLEDAESLRRHLDSVTDAGAAEAAKALRACLPLCDTILETCKQELELGRSSPSIQPICMMLTASACTPATELCTLLSTAGLEGDSDASYRVLSAVAATSLGMGPLLVGAVTTAVRPGSRVTCTWVANWVDLAMRTAAEVARVLGNPALNPRVAAQLGGRSGQASADRFASLNGQAASALQVLEGTAVRTDLELDLWNVVLQSLCQALDWLPALLQHLALDRSLQAQLIQMAVQCGKQASEGRHATDPGPSRQTWSSASMWWLLGRDELSGALEECIASGEGHHLLPLLAEEAASLAALEVEELVNDGVALTVLLFSTAAASALVAAHRSAAVGAEQSRLSRAAAALALDAEATEGVLGAMAHLRLPEQVVSRHLELLRLLPDLYRSAVQQQPSTAGPMAIPVDQLFGLADMVPGPESALMPELHAACVRMSSQHCTELCAAGEAMARLLAAAPLLSGGGGKTETWCTYVVNSTSRLTFCAGAQFAGSMGGEASASAICAPNGQLAAFCHLTTSVLKAALLLASPAWPRSAGRQQLRQLLMKPLPGSMLCVHGALQQYSRLPEQEQEQHFSLALHTLLQLEQASHLCRDYQAEALSRNNVSLMRLCSIATVTAKSLAVAARSGRLACWVLPAAASAAAWALDTFAAVVEQPQDESWSAMGHLWLEEGLSEMVESLHAASPQALASLQLLGQTLDAVGAWEQAIGTAPAAPIQHPPELAAAIAAAPGQLRQAAAQVLAAGEAARGAPGTHQHRAWLLQQEVALATRRCAHLGCTNMAGASEASLTSRRCGGGCGSAGYCGEVCQRADWRRHKVACRLLAAERQAAAAGGAGG